MSSTRWWLSVLATAMLPCLYGTMVLGDEKKAELEKKSGTVVGVLTAKGEAWVEVKADGEEKARRYTAHWVGGGPQEGGGPDKEIVKVIKGLKVDSRVRLEWKFDERPRVVKIEVLKSAGDKGTLDKQEEKDATKKGTVVGKLTSKEKNGIELKADGDERARRYFFHRAGTKELHDVIDHTPVGSRVRIDWIFIERPRVIKLEVIKRADKDQ
jgi:hypothetical protein